MHRKAVAALALAATLVAFGMNGRHGARAAPEAADRTQGMAIMSATIDMVGLNLDAVIRSGAGVVGVYRGRIGDDPTYVRFARDLQGCTAVVSPTQDGQVFVMAHPDAQTFPGPGGTSLRDSIMVRTRSSLGQLPISFSLIVFCGK